MRPLRPPLGMGKRWQLQLLELEVELEELEQLTQGVL